MNRSQRIAIWVLTLIGLLAAWKLFGQGFGNFRTDQPFLARNYSASAVETWPDQSNLLVYLDTRDITNVTFSGTTDVVTNWFNKVSAQGYGFMTDLATAPRWNTNGGPYGTNSTVFFDGDFHWMDFYPTNVQPFVSNVTVAVLFTATNIDRCLPIGFGEPDRQFAILDDFHDSSKGLMYQRGAFGSPTIETGVRVPVNTWMLAMVSAGVGAIMFTNSVYVGTNNLGGGFTVNQVWHVGRWSTAVGASHAGKIARVMLWKSQLSSNDCVVVSDKIKAQFGL